MCAACVQIFFKDEPAEPAATSCEFSPAEILPAQRNPKTAADFRDPEAGGAADARNGELASRGASRPAVSPTGGGSERENAPRVVFRGLCHARAIRTGARSDSSSARAQPGGGVQTFQANLLRLFASSRWRENPGPGSCPQEH